MKIIVAGPRDVHVYMMVKLVLDRIVLQKEITEILSGGATGVDALAERYAKEHSIPLKVLKAEWDKYGKYAGPRRNNEMAKYGDYLIAFKRRPFGTRGTNNMIELMREKNKPVEIVWFNP